MLDNWNSFVMGLAWIFGGLFLIMALAALVALAIVIIRNSGRRGPGDP